MLPMSIVLIEENPSKELLINKIAQKIQAIKSANEDVYKFSQGKEGCEGEKVIANFRGIAQGKGYFIVYLNDGEIKIAVQEVLNQLK